MYLVKVFVSLFVAAAMRSAFAEFSYDRSQAGTYADPSYENDRFQNYPYYRYRVDRQIDKIFQNENPNNWRAALYGNLPRNTVILKDSRRKLYTPCRADLGVHILYGKSDGKKCYVEYRGEIYAVPFFEVWAK